MTPRGPPGGAPRGPPGGPPGAPRRERRLCRNNQNRKWPILDFGLQNSVRSFVLPHRKGGYATRDPKHQEGLSALVGCAGGG